MSPMNPITNTNTNSDRLQFQLHVVVRLDINQSAKAHLTAASATSEVCHAHRECDYELDYDAAVAAFHQMMAANGQPLDD